MNRFTTTVPLSFRGKSGTNHYEGINDNSCPDFIFEDLGDTKLSSPSKVSHEPRRRGLGGILRRKSNQGELRMVANQATTTGSPDVLTSRVRQMRAGLDGRSSKVTTMADTTDNKTYAKIIETAPSAAHLNYDDADDTAATEDMSSSSAFWTESELNLREIKPLPNSPKMTSRAVMDRMTRKHVLKLRLTNTVETLDKVLAKCRLLKEEIARLEEDEKFDHISDLNDELSSEEYSVDESLEPVQEEDEEDSEEEEEEEEED